MTPFLLVLSSPSGGGKTTIARHLREARPDVGYSVSATTRAPRGNEMDGVDYHFLPRAEFERRAAAGEFVEWAEYGGNLYGTLHAEIARIFAEGRHAVLDIEVQGARQLRERYPQAVQVFVLPPSASVLVQRLTGRATDSVHAVGTRLRRAADELLDVSEYDYVIVNEDLHAAVAQVQAIMQAEIRRVSRHPDLARTVAALRSDVLVEAERFPVLTEVTKEA